MAELTGEHLVDFVTLFQDLIEYAMTIYWVFDQIQIINYARCYLVSTYLD